MRTPFFGAHAVARSLNWSDCKLINLYPEISETKQGRDVGALFAMPGLTQLTTIGTGPIYAMLQLNSGLQKLYVVSGSTLYSMDGALNVTTIGAVNGSPPFTMVQNGLQLAIFGNGQGTSYSVAGGLGTITMPFSATGQIVPAYLDGFALINNPGTTEIFQSDSLDLTMWNVLAFGSATADADFVVALAQSQRLIFAIKAYETEFFQDVGSSPFAFQSQQGIYAEVGCVAASSVSAIGESLMWLAQNRAGEISVVQMDQYRPTRISTHAMETEIQGYSTISDAIGFAYGYAGHLFYVLTFPTANVTWFYDKTTSELLKTPIWGQWLCYQSGAFTRHLANCYVSFFGEPLVGSYLDGAIYKIDPTNFSDGALTRQWLRSWRALPKATQEPTSFSRLTIDMETGGAGTTGNPNVSLRWSDDGGHTFSSSVTAAVGAAGSTATRVFFSRLGSTRRNTGLDRIFELSGSGNFPVRLFGAELE